MSVTVTKNPDIYFTVYLFQGLQSVLKNHLSRYNWFCIASFSFWGVSHYKSSR